LNGWSNPELAGAQLCNQTPEPGAHDGPSGGSTRVVIDDLDVPEASSARDIDEFVLAALTLAVRLNLGLTGLSNVHHGLALQHHRREEFRPVHHGAPRSH
jgi:hypothetical protein